MATKTETAQNTITTPQKITTFLMFNKGAADAVKLYASAFKDAKIISLGDLGTGPDGTRLVNATFEIAGQRFIAMDGGPSFSFAQGISLFVDCQSQQEIDDLSAKLTSKGGEQQPCGWVKDRFGVSWQIIPTTLGAMLSDPRSGNSRKVMEAMLKMKKLDIKKLEDAYRQR